MEMKAKKNKKHRIGEKQDWLFFLCLVAWPIIHFCIFYIGINFDSFLLSFQKITLDFSKGGYVKEFSLETFPIVWETVTSKAIIEAAGISLLSYAISQAVGLTLSLLFSYYISKQYAFAGFFRVILFLPSILSSVVMVTLYQYFLDYAFLDIVRDITGVQAQKPLLNRGPVAQYLTITVYNVWIGFGSGVLMYSNTMSGISPEIYDAAAIDGAQGIREFWHISIPLSFSTISVFVTTGIAHIFTNQYSLYTFFGANAPFQNFGYYIFKQTYLANGNMTYYPELACLGLMMSAVCIPLTFTARYLLKKFGPSEE